MKEFFESLSRGGEEAQDLADQAGRLGCDLAAPYVVLHAVPWNGDPGPAIGRAGRARAVLPGGLRDRCKAPGPESKTGDWRDLADRIEFGLATGLPDTIFDHRETSMRALLRVLGAGPEGLYKVVQRTYEEVVGEERGALSVGLSNVCQGAASFPQGFEEAASAASVGPLIRGEQGVFAYEDLGPYRYVLTSEQAVRDPYQERLDRLDDYDRRRGTDLLDTLERYLDCRGNVGRTSRSLYVHPNTLRQRLRRIKRVAEFDLDREDWLSLGIAIRIVKLRLMRRSALRQREAEDG